MTDIYLKAKYRVIKFILCQTNENKFRFFPKKDFEEFFLSVPLKDYCSSDDKYWPSWAKKAIEQVLSGELKPFYTANIQKEHLDSCLCTCEINTLMWYGCQCKAFQKEMEKIGTQVT